MDQDGADGHPDIAVLPRPIRAVVFDLDGTLLDTEKLYRAAFLAALAEFGARLDEKSYDRLVGLPTPERRRLLPAMLGRAFPVSPFLDAYYRHRAVHLTDGLPVKPGVMATLDALDRDGIPYGVATSASTGTARAHLTRAGLLHRFACVVTRDDVACGKPAPDSFLRAAALLGVHAVSCLAVEDSPAGVLAAYGSGMMVALVPDAVACDAATLDRCAVTLASLHDLAPLLAIAEPAL